MNIKICGNRSSESVDAAVEAGATHVGFIMSPGFKRSVTASEVFAMTDGVPDDVEKVGVFVNADINFVEKSIAEAELTMIQLHGAEDQLYINKFSKPVIKVISKVEEAAKFAGNVTLLIDHAPGKSGAGIDLTQDFGKIQQQFMVAGGLTPENVAERVEFFSQFPNFAGVDVSSGVETNGVKDVRKIKEFIENARK
ncbi:MAG: phosphoribosylanthranilate isomerase [Streptococcaceae bacterium]|jgi:phosphoribosylanthranilate isomerase|nr:phosphoribosylanthranilate isomerase [Streptococcaceae bacterium]